MGRRVSVAIVFLLASATGSATLNSFMAVVGALDQEASNDNIHAYDDDGYSQHHADPDCD